MISPAKAVERLRLTADESLAIAKLEATIDAQLYANFDGGSIRLEFNETISRRIAVTLTRHYEEGGWRVTLQIGQRSFTLLLAPVWLATPSPALSTTNALPPVVKNEQLSSKCDLRLLVRMPTRSRPAQALVVLQRYRDLAGVPIAIEVVIDEDDESMLAVEVLQRLAGLGCTITVGSHKSKVEAVNGGRVQDWDVLLLASDDMVPVADGYAARVLEAMEKNWPHFDGALYFSDAYQNEKCCTLPIMGRRLYQQFGYVYQTEYKSLFVDQEQTDVLKSMGRLIYVDEQIIEHRHPVTGVVPSDALYQRNDALWQSDKSVYEQRRARNFDTPPLRLSICICSLPARRTRLDWLLDHIYAQIIPKFSREVEVLVDDRLEPTVGAKRQALLERARGQYIVYVDDDDAIAHDYTARIVCAVRDQPGVDCVAIQAVMTTSGSAPEQVNFSRTHGEDCYRDGVHIRKPNHLCPVRRELALQVGFKSMLRGEDFDYAARLLPLLKTEVLIGQPTYFYFYDPNKVQESVK